MAKVKIIKEQGLDLEKELSVDLEPIGDGGLESVEDIDGVDELGDDLMGEEDYAYVITIEETENETSMSPEDPAEDGEKEYTFILSKKGSEEEMDDEFGDMEEIQSELDQPNNGGFEDEHGIPRFESKGGESILEAIDPMTGQPTTDTPIPAPGLPEESDLEAIEDADLEPDEEVAQEIYNFKEEELIEFFNTVETESEIFLDEETPFDIEEVVDYLKLYPESDLFVKVEDIEAFDQKLADMKEGESDDEEGIGSELQSVEIGGDEALELGDDGSFNHPDAQVFDNLPMESFSVLNIKNKKNVGDGLYIADLHENKVYGKFESIKLIKNKLVIDKKVYPLKNDINLKEAKGQESIEILLENRKVATELRKRLSKSGLVIKL